MRYYGVLALMLAGAILGLMTPVYAASLFLWHDIFQPFSFAYQSVGFSTANAVFLVLVFSYVFNIIRGTFRPQVNQYIFLTALFLLWVLVCAIMSSYEPAMGGFFTILKYLTPLALISTMITKRSDALIIGAILTFSVGIWSAQAGVKGLTSGVANNMAIPGGQMTDNNDFMVATVSIIPLISFFLFNYSGIFKKTARAFLALMFFLSLCAIVFSNSRGATVGLGVTFLIYLMMISTHRIRDFLIVAALCGVGFFFLPDSFFERMSTIDLSATQTEDSAAERMIMMQAAWVATLASPIFGYGPYCWTLVAPSFAGGRGLEPHNHWVKLSSETGFVGVFLFLIVFGFTLYQLFSVRNRARSANDILSSSFAAALITSLFGFLSAATFVSHPYSEFLWALLALSNGFTHNFSSRRAGVGHGLRSWKRKRRNMALPQPLAPNPGGALE